MRSCRLRFWRLNATAARRAYFAVNACPFGGSAALESHKPDNFKTSGLHGIAVSFSGSGSKRCIYDVVATAGQVKRQACGSKKLADDVCQLCSSRGEPLRHQVRAVQQQHIEGVKHYRALWTAAAMLERLERGLPASIQGDNFPI